jgi:CO/xanthine dehydrogenase Mo-binding subunit
MTAGNAVFDTTGMRLREVPFMADRLKATLATGPGGEEFP